MWNSGVAQSAVTMTIGIYRERHTSPSWRAFREPASLYLEDSLSHNKSHLNSKFSHILRGWLEAMNTAYLQRRRLH
jgi:hypothetical protein